MLNYTFSSLFYSPGFFSRLKEKGALAKDVWGVIGSAYVSVLSRLYLSDDWNHRLSVRDVMLEMEKLQAKGEAGEEELRALEMDVTGKVCVLDVAPYLELRPVQDHVGIVEGSPSRSDTSLARSL